MHIVTRTVVVLTLALVAAVPGIGHAGAPWTGAAPAVSARSGSAPTAGHESTRFTHGAASVGATSYGWASFNWAGYVVTGRTVSSVGGTWRVPRVLATARPSASAMWVGVDGVRDRQLIQAGTEQDFAGGAAHYWAWWEVLPAPAVRITAFSVRPGDTIRAIVERLGRGRWRISLSDSRGGSFSTVRAYAGPGSSAEWIEEAPIVAGRLAALARHGMTGFDNAMLNRASPRFVPSEAGVLVRSGSALETPSAPDSDRNGFALAEGAAAPPAPRT